MRNRFFAETVSLGALLLTAPLSQACKQSAQGQFESKDSSGRASHEAPHVVARLGDLAFTREGVDSSMRGYVYELRVDALKTQLLKEMLATQAAARSVTPEEFYQTEIERHAPPPFTPVESRALYEEARAAGRVGGDVAYEVFEKQVGEARLRVHEHQQKDALFWRLAKKAGLKVDHEALGHVAAQVTSPGPSLGSSKAPIQITEYADYTADFAPLGNVALMKVLQEFGDRVRVRFRTYPKSEEALRAAEAALCADEQGEFMDYRELLLGRPVETTMEALQQYAGKIALNEAKFVECLKSGRQRSAIAQHKAEYERNMLQGQPSWVINGFAIGGAIPTEQFLGIVQSMLDGVFL